MEISPTIGLGAVLHRRSSSADAVSTGPRTSPDTARRGRRSNPRNAQQRGNGRRSEAVSFHAADRGMIERWRAALVSPLSLALEQCGA